MHKEGNPGRSVVSSLTSHTSKIPEYVNFDLQPIVKRIPYCVKDTNDFIRELDAIKSVPDNTYLASLDVKSSYASISFAE